MKVIRQKKEDGVWVAFEDDMTIQEEIQWREKEIEDISKELLDFMLQKLTLELGIGENKSIPTDKMALAQINYIWGIKADKRKQLYEQIENLQKKENNGIIEEISNTL